MANVGSPDCEKGAMSTNYLGWLWDSKPLTARLILISRSDVECVCRKGLSTGASNSVLDNIRAATAPGLGVGMCLEALSVGRFQRTVRGVPHILRMTASGSPMQLKRWIVISLG